MNVNQELDYVIQSLMNIVGSMGYYKGLNIINKIDLAYRLSRRLNSGGSTNNTSTSTSYNNQLNILIYNLTQQVGSLGDYYSLGLEGKIYLAYRLAQRLQYLTTTTSTSTTTTTTV